jgi:hypothetical protein
MLARRCRSYRRDRSPARDDGGNLDGEDLRCARCSMPTEGTMADTRQFGDIATKLLLENDRVRIWEMRLEPGQRSALHRHDNDYVMIQIDGDRMAADFESDSGGPWAGSGGRVEGDIAPGNVIYAERGGVETAVNVGSKPFYEIVVELKD